ncbi:MAG: MAC/perforin domain-containing protein [Dysgonomonas sp.]|nr:MAC/perforin domain-containing protein [Dysgonomonas sp.]
MKKNHYYLFILLFSLFLSCSENNVIDSNIDESGMQLRSSGDGAYDVLGYGYDVTKPYLSKNAVSQYQVIDVKTLIDTEPKNLVYFDKGAYAGTQTRVYSAEDYSSYSKSVIEKTNFSASVSSNGILSTLTKGMFSADVKANQETKDVVTTSSAYSYATAEVYGTHRRFVLDADVTLIQKYLNPFFKQELEKVSTSTDAYNLVKKYGTHVLFRFTTGGIFKAEFKGITFENGTITSKKNAAETGGKFILSKIGLGATAGWENTTETEMKNKFISWYGNITSSGGSTNGLSINISATQGTNYSLNVGNWLGSINDNNAVLVDLDWNKTYPLHMLIVDQNKANLVKNAINTYIKNNSAEQYNTYPLFRYWNNNTQSSYLSNTYEVKSGWMFDKIIGYSAHRTFPEGGSYTPFTQYKHKNKDIYLVSNGRSSDPSYNSDYRSVDRRLGNFRTNKPEVMQIYSVLYRFKNNKTGSFYYTVDPRDSRMNSNWVKDNELGYVLSEISNY